MPTQPPRPNLEQTVQQFNATPASALVAMQIEPFAGAGSMAGQSDLAVLDASAGPFALTLPSARNVVLGKPYTFAETDGANAVTLTASGTGTIDGAGTLVLAAGTSVGLLPIAIADVGDSVTWISQASSTVAGTDADAIHVNVAGEIAGIAPKATPIAADVLVIEDSAAANAKASITIGTLPIAQAQVSSTVAQVGADAPFLILDTTGGIQLASSTAGSKAIATTSSYAGQKIHIILLAAAGGDYTLALDVGTLTFNAAGESAVVQRDAGNTAWICVGLSGATIV